MMKIDTANPGAPIRHPENTSQAAGRPAGSVRHSSPDRVHLSPVTQNVRAEESDSPERQAHVNQITASVQGGHYRVHPAVVSASVIRHSMVVSAHG